MKTGDKVYTVNNKTGKVDLWVFNGYMPTNRGLLAHLSNGRKYCFLPVRCVFETEIAAMKIATTHN